MLQNTRPISRFAQCATGSVLPMFGLIVVPVLGVVGASLDFATAYSAQAKLQRALDAATVAVCGGGTGTQTTEEIVRAYLEADLSGGGLNLLAPAGDGEQPQPQNGDVTLADASFDPDTGALIPKLNTTIETRLLKLVGINELAVDVQSEIACAGKRLEVSLVLDVTGSMDESIAGKKKIASMKEAAHDVVDIFERSMQRGKARIALVPFSSAVNAGSLADQVRGTIANGNGQEVGKQEFMFRDKDDYNNWLRYDATQCVSERRGPQSYTDAAPGCSGNSCSAPVGHVYTASGNCDVSHEILPLTNDISALEQAIDSYTPSGNTAGHIGTAWGWYLLSNKWASILPSDAQPEPANLDELIKATIIMTDGRFNDQFYRGVDDDMSWEAAENGSSDDQFDALCANMKDPDGDGVYNNDSLVVYTIGFGITENSPEGQRLKSCATDNTKYFFPYDGDELRAAFVTIGKELSGGQSGFPIVRQ